MLDLKEVNVFRGNIHVLHDISFRVGEGEVIALMGPNGAGKTTLLETIIGLHKPRTGTIEFARERINDLEPYQRVSRGITLVPEGKQIFPYMTVLENLLMGAYNVRDKEKINESLELVFELFPRLKERKNQKAGTLSGGEQQMLAIARALIPNPKLLMLDEPSSGLMPKLVTQIFQVLKELIREGKKSIILVEQHIRALDLVDRALMLENGRIVLEGDPESLKGDKRVREVYLGL